ncbi:stage II sporulation protein E [Actinoplanes lutulentus]|uniref:Stage II sporulation protein E n=1 Tax=Actinoplanes lutulentus TaxID=1287878 RepID=A0A327ZK65_9ACTN|nr:stage II sporulation protein E [Actinoplanes lutulentus]
MVSDNGDGEDWACTLHAMWTSVAMIGVRDELAELVLPPLLAQPGVAGVWGLRHADGGVVIAYRWAGLDLEGERRGVAERIAADKSTEIAADADLRALGVTRVLKAHLEVGGEPSGTFMLLIDDTADAGVLAGRLAQVVDVTREALRRLAAGRLEQQQHIRDALLAEASLQMDAVLDTTQTMNRIPRMAVPAIAEGCLVYVYDGGKPVLRSSVHVDRRRLSAMLADPATVDRLATIALEAASGVPDFDGTVMNPQVLRARGRVIGVLIFLFDREPERIPPVAFLRDIASRAALAIDNSTLYEQRRDEIMTLQRHLLPSRLPSVEGLSIAASYAVGDQHLEVGGDFYDVVVRDDGTVAALIGDVCGRGVDAAALTGMARHTLAALVDERLPASRAMSRLNARLRLDGSWRFVTAGVAMLRPAGENFDVQWLSAGHPAPILLRRDAPPRRGRGGGVPLGILPEPRFGRSRVRLAPGDTLVIFTDGLTESRDPQGRMFEDGALTETLDQLRDAPVETLVNELSRAAAAYGDARADDIAVLAIRVELP